MKDTVRHIIERPTDALSLFSANNDCRGQVEITSQTLLIIIAVGLIGGLGIALSGSTDNILPGPDGNIEIQQSGDTVSLTIDTLDDDVDDVGIAINEDHENLTNLEEDSDTIEGAELIFDTAASGQTGTFDIDWDSEVEDGDEVAVNVIAYDDDGDQSNRIATYTATYNE